MSYMRQLNIYNIKQIYKYRNSAEQNYTNCEQTFNVNQQRKLKNWCKNE